MNDSDLLLQIVHRELFYGCLSPNIGLYSGKMGLSIFLYHYARFTDNDLFADFAGELIDEVCDNIYDGIPLSFANGLSGIGWGLEYLAGNRFIEIENNDAFQEINHKILEINPDNVRDCSLETGLEGIAAYVHAQTSAARAGTQYFTPAFIRALERRCTPRADRLIWQEIINSAQTHKPVWQNGMRILLAEKERENNKL